MALHLDVDWNGHGFEIDVMRTKAKMPWRRVAIRNSEVRQQSSGHCHYERWWWRGWSISLHWGQHNPVKPSQYYNPKERKWLPKGT
jgi:hypothetical protein